MPADTRTITEVAPALAARRVTSQALTESCLERIAERNASINAFIRVFEDDAREQARGADAEIAAGHHRGPLHGVPVSLKDLIDVRGVATTAASRVRSGHVAPGDAAIVSRLREAGAVIIGKTNLHEFAFGTTNEDSAFGPVLHPLDPARSPGGSSGGSAASVLDGMAFASIGTDTGGSVRIPAAACGLVGLKPGFGEISTHGVVPLSVTLDHAGPLCRSVPDAAILYDVLCGSVPQPLQPVRMGGLKLGVPRDYFLSLLDTQVAAAFDAACARLAAAGAVLEDVAIPHAGDISPVYLHIVLAEAAAYHAKTLESRPDDYTGNVRVRLEMGRYILAEDYVRALRGREVLMQEVDDVLQGRDALLLPALAMPATKLGVSTVRLGTAEEPVRNVMLRLTQLFNITGHPAVAMPCGRTVEGLPMSAQLVGARGGSRRLLQIAAGAEPYVGPGTSR